MLTTVDLSESNRSQRSLVLDAKCDVYNAACVLFCQCRKDVGRLHLCIAILHRHKVWSGPSVGLELVAVALPLTKHDV